MLSTCLKPKQEETRSTQSTGKSAWETSQFIAESTSLSSLDRIEANSAFGLKKNQGQNKKNFITGTGIHERKGICEKKWHKKMSENEEDIKPSNQLSLCHW